MSTSLPSLAPCTNHPCPVRPTASLLLPADRIPPVAFRFVSFQQAHAARTRIPATDATTCTLCVVPPSPPARRTYVRAVILLGSDVTQHNACNHRCISVDVECASDKRMPTGGHRCSCLRLGHCSAPPQLTRRPGRHQPIQPPDNATACFALFCVRASSSFPLRHAWAGLGKFSSHLGSVQAAAAWVRFTPGYRNSAFSTDMWWCLRPVCPVVCSTLRMWV